MQNEEKLSKVEREIEEVKEDIKKVGKKLEQEGLSEKDIDYYRKKEIQLLEKESLLLEKEKHLREEKKQLLQRQETIYLNGFSAERLETIAAFAEAEMENKTKNKPMSEASVVWAESILAAYHVKHEWAKTVIVEPGPSDDPPPYVWTIESQSGEEWNKSEYGGTPGALAWLKEHLLGSNSKYDVKIVTGSSLPKVKGNRKSATGKADIAIGDANDIKYGDTYAYVQGLIELKTDKYPLKTGQNLLELLSLSTASSFKKAVVLLATNCTDRWEVFHFSTPATIRHQVYKHGRKAWEDFMGLLHSISERNYPEKLWIAALPEMNEQDLEGFEVSDKERKRAKAEQDEAMLEHFADRLGDIYGERPTVPSWARAHVRIPDYYSLC